ncbi:HNH endonuclease, partial [Gordonia sp. DT30]
AEAAEWEAQLPVPVDADAPADDSNPAENAPPAEDIPAPIVVPSPVITPDAPAFTLVADSAGVVVPRLRGYGVIDPVLAGE